ncbi:MAG: hypothetical protein HFE78_08295 [Clostridiales bacterium]|nr:hypothetical protein [Clostridiales bacterium]
MFGYIKPNREEMKVKEYHAYQAVYCGLCKCMGKCVSCSARFTLRYDFVFLALLRSALLKENFSFEQGRCFAHPFKKKVYALPNDSLIFCARASALLSYYQIEDQLLDHKGIHQLKYRALLLPAKRMLHKVDSLSELEQPVANHLHRLHQLEAAKEPSADAPAEIFGQLLGEVASFDLPATEKRIAHEICFHLGKWIYFADALDDLEKDRKTGNYNPLLTDHGPTLDQTVEFIIDAMAMERKAIGRAFDLIDFEDKDLKAILGNILEEGLPLAEQKIQAKTEKNNARSL